YSWEEKRIVGVGEDTVVGLVYHRARIKGTDIPVAQPMGTIWMLAEDGLGTEVHFFLTWDEALKAAGLPT
ncbi:MAG: hypothetical protein H0V29_01885, partial [Thermoleophilaceae bacterium]|nr:hypothetical protein [Thermoleophilaceae bacterium]